jgi:hypothetical protein
MKTKTAPVNAGSHNQLIIFLSDCGIRPSSFAFFLSEYIKRKPAKKAPVLSFLISSQLKSQAELIHYHLND